MSVQTAKNKPVIIGITGGIATGKSTVVAYLRTKDYIIFDSDLAVKAIWEQEESVINHIKNRYDINIKTIEGKKALAELIFKDITVRKAINQLVHPIVYKKIDEWKSKNSNEKYLLIDMPLLFEVNYQKQVDAVLLVYLKPNLQINRLMLRDGINYEYAVKKISAQLPIEDKKSLTKYVVDNSYDIKTLYQNIDKVMEEIKDEIK